MCAISFVWCRFASIFHASYEKFDVHSSWANKKKLEKEQESEIESGHCPVSPSYFILCFWWCSSYRHTLVILYTLASYGDAKLSRRNNVSHFVDENPLAFFHLFLSLFHASKQVFRIVLLCVQRTCVLAWQSSTNPKNKHSATIQCHISRGNSFIQFS